jgi:hypothetical protein
MTPSIAQNPPNCKHIPSSSSPLKHGLLGQHASHGPRRKGAAARGPSGRHGQHSRRSRRRKGCQLPGLPGMPGQMANLSSGLHHWGLLFFIIGGLAGGWLMSCIADRFCKPCWRPYCPAGLRRRWRAARRVSTSAFEESGAAATSDICACGSSYDGGGAQACLGRRPACYSSSSSSSSSPGVCAERERRARCSFGRRDTWEGPVGGDPQGGGGGGWGAGV